MNSLYTLKLELNAAQEELSKLLSSGNLNKKRKELHQLIVYIQNHLEQIKQKQTKRKMNPPTLPDYIKPGAFVRLRNGKKAKIYEINETGSYPIHGAILFSDNVWYMKEWHSEFFCESQKESPIDIVGPWTDTPDCSELWPQLPPWINWVAMDSDGSWYAFPDKPNMTNTRFDPATKESWNYLTQIPKEYAPKYSGSWENSLTERPI